MILSSSPPLASLPSLARFPSISLRFALSRSSQSSYTSRIKLNFEPRNFETLFSAMHASLLCEFESIANRSRAGRSMSDFKTRNGCAVEFYGRNGTNNDGVGKGATMLQQREGAEVGSREREEGGWEARQQLAFALGGSLLRVRSLWLPPAILLSRRRQSRSPLLALCCRCSLLSLLLDACLRHQLADRLLQIVDATYQQQQTQHGQQ